MKQHFALSKLYKALALCLCTSSSYSFAVEYADLNLKTLDGYQEEFKEKFTETFNAEKEIRKERLSNSALEITTNPIKTKAIGAGYHSVVFDRNTDVEPSSTPAPNYSFNPDLFYDPIGGNNLLHDFLNFEVKKDVSLNVNGLFRNNSIENLESMSFIENNGKINIKRTINPNPDIDPDNKLAGGTSFGFSTKAHNNLINKGTINFNAEGASSNKKGIDLMIYNMKILDNQGMLSLTGESTFDNGVIVYCGSLDTCRTDINKIDVFSNSGKISVLNKMEIRDINYFHNSGTILTDATMIHNGIDIKFNKLGINTSDIKTAGGNSVTILDEDKDSVFINAGNIDSTSIGSTTTTTYKGTFINDKGGNINSKVYIYGDRDTTQFINRGVIKGAFDIQGATVYLGDGKVLGEEENRLDNGVLVLDESTEKTNIKSAITGQDSSILEFRGNNHNSGFTPEDLPDFVDLNVYGNWTLDNIINVSDSVNIESGSLTLNQSAPQNFAAEINIGDAQDVNQARETLSVKNIDALGSGTITLNGNSLFVLNTAYNGTLTNAKITNSVTDENVQMVKLGSGKVRLKQAEFFGRLDIDEGAIILDHSTTPTVNLAQINIAPNAEFVALNGMHSQANVVNNGVMYLGHAKNEQTISALPVTIQSYQGGSASTLEFNGKLGGDNSPFERLIVTGDTGGSSIIAINNIGGRGAKTVNGIKLIEVQGESDATFELKEKISLGVYDYILEKVLKNWYLKSTIKPESGLFVSNLWAANQLFDLNLADRIGDPSLNGDDPVRRNLSVWVKARYDALKWRDEDNLFDNNVNTRSIQLGSDFGSWKDKYGNRWQIGAMGAYGTANASTTNTESDFSANGKLSGFNIGLYATVFGAQNWYVDSWLAWNEFKGKILGEDPLSYALNGVTASLESGYSYKWFDTSRYDVFIQPKVQLTWFGVGIDGGHVTYLDSELSDESGNLRSKLSARLYAKPKNLNGVAFQPFFEASWIHNTKPYAIEVPDQQITMAGIKNTAEAKLGFEAKIADQTDIWLNTAYQFGGQSYRQFTAQAGMSYRF